MRDNKIDAGIARALLLLLIPIELPEGQTQRRAARFMAERAEEEQGLALPARKPRRLGLRA